LDVFQIFGNPLPDREDAGLEQSDTYSEMHLIRFGVCGIEAL
jgi:hypothetical protein